MAAGRIDQTEAYTTTHITPKVQGTSKKRKQKGSKS